MDYYFTITLFVSIILISIFILCMIGYCCFCQLKREQQSVEENDNYETI